MVLLDIRLDNLYAFKNFQLNLTYPKKIIGSTIPEEHLADRPNFRYKKVNILMGSNASGKTSLGKALRGIFNFLAKKSYSLLASIIGDPTAPASFTLCLASAHNVLYRVHCDVAPRSGDEYNFDDIRLEVRQENIWQHDSFESCVKRLEEAPYTPESLYLKELEKLGPLDWMFEFPEDVRRILVLPDKDEQFRAVLEKVLKALDPSIESVEISQEVEKTYIVRLPGHTVILQNGEMFDTTVLSSGTKAGVEVAQMISAMLQRKYTFFYCDEKFPYVHSDMEKAMLSLMIDLLHPNDQLFFTTHNTDVLDMDLPKHTFTFLRKNVYNTECPITCVSAADFLKRRTDSLKNAVENDLFLTAPATDLIYAIADPCGEGEQ